VTLLAIHILAGVLALVFGYVALFATKGAALHRKSGLLFVFAMVTLSLTGALVAFLNTSSVSLVAGLLTFYFVTTALLTVRHRSQESHRIDAAAMLFALAVALLGLKTGLHLSKTDGPYIPALLPIPVLVPIVVMLYWLCRVRIRKTTLGIVGVSAPQVSGATK
jgi:uncharacterized membrane protein